jgi:DNA-binding winged helix-turn-helix (wHTH) protein
MEGVDASPQAPVRLVLDHEQGWRGAEVLRLRPKSFAVLRHLVAQAGRVVSSDELLEVVWPETAVSDGVLKVCLHELRQALGDTAQAPQYIETVPRRGYRWIGPLAAAEPPAATAPRPLLAVGREAECARLHAWLAQARRGRRQVGFISGEAGIGKTTLVDTVLAQVASQPDLVLARGQCIEHYGAGDPYLPVLAALGQLGRGPHGAWVVAELTQHAPSWLVQLPGLLTSAALEAVQRRSLGTTRAGMLLQLAEAVEALSRERTLVLVLEDLHWSDIATLELVAFLARRREAAPFLLLGTYRPEEVRGQGRPLRVLTLELQLQGQGAELPLERLSAGHVTTYLAGRLAGAVPNGLAAALHRRTDGHPLFLVTVVDTLVHQGILQEGADTGS